MNIFIDTSIYLSFYHFSNDDLVELEKLIVAIKANRIRLWLPQQVIDEFRRNREAKISDALKLFSDQKPLKSYPQFCKDYPEFNELIKLADAYEENKTKLLESLSKNIKNNTLKADNITESLFSIAEVLKVDSDTLDKARTRYDRGNPPGKNGSYGDAINWELLLSNIPRDEDLNIIARDKDYVSALDKGSLCEFLISEWRQVKGTDLAYYPTLSDYFIVHFPQIKLASELEKKFVINNLANSSSFISTHSIVSKLRAYTDFSDQEANDIATALVSNNQISLISDDPDINSFVGEFLDANNSKIEPERIEEIENIYFPDEEQEKTLNPDIY